LVVRLPVNYLTPVCYHCKEEIEAAAPRWTAREPGEFWHYKCAETARLTSGERFKAVIAARSISN
jgi:hypothetical protein